MSERKVLNKYYPPDFDPSKIPRLHLSKDRQYTVRLMAPCNMKCTTCGEYIYKGKKFNARKETVQGEEYLGIKIFRFYIKCTRCLAEITFKTDPQNSDYIVELGATRNFQALKLAEEQAEREQREIEEEEASNPMKLLEKRTKASKFEMEMLESLEELRELNQRHAHVDFDKLLQQNGELAIKLKQKQEDDDEAFIKSVFGQNGDGTAVKRILDDDSDEDEEPVLKKGSALFLKDKASEILTEGLSAKQSVTKQTSSDGTGTSKSKVNLRALVKPKTSNAATVMPRIKATAEVPIKTEHKGSPVQTAATSSTSGTLVQTASKSSALSLLGAYSDSDSNE